MSSGEAERLVHPALEPAPGAPLDEARLSDRERLAVALQGAALLAHLERAGWRLVDGWRGARIGAGAVLRAVRAAPGRNRSPAPSTPAAMTALLRLLFGGGEGAVGRGQGRRVARQLAAEWRPGLSTTGGDAAVARILELAPFLWRREFGPARRSLAAEYVHDGRRELWLSGPAAARRRLAAQASDLSALAALLAGPEARSGWEGPAPGAAEDRLAEAWRLVERGKFGAALAAVAGWRAPEAAILRLHCQRWTAELGAARAGLRRLAAVRLTAAQLVAAAEAAVPVLCLSGDLEGARDWAQRALRGARGPLRCRALIQTALAAQYRRDFAAAEAALDGGRAALDDPDVGWRWRRARAMGLVGRGESATAAGELVQALRGARRRLGRADAASLWNDLALARVQSGDLAGAERACRLAVRLWGACEGPQRLTVALFNLAEIRLRRGRAAGAWEILERCLREDERSGNVLGLVHDAELVARYELLQGRPETALERCREALAGLERRHAEGPRGELTVLMARALGWLGRAEESAAALEAAPGAAAGAVLEPEELPGLLALAGRTDAALAAAAATPVATLWRAALGGESAAASEWSALRRLEPFAAARLVFDLELVAPGGAPAYWRRWAAAQLRRSGAIALAERLEASETGPWRALEAYASANPGGRQALAELFAGAGYPDVRLVARGVRGERVLVAGTGGDEELLAPLAHGTLELRAPLVDELLRALFALVRRDLGEAAESGEDAAGGPRHGGIVGQSPALLAAFDRVERLAAGELPVLILGETGTGKELVAQQVHRLSGRAAGPFLALNCAAFSETLLVSELFGHARGSFTGADRDRPGVFETARGGTVFLDEIGDLPAAAQGMLLRVLQEKEVRRVGESQSRQVDVRVIAATHRDLAEMVRRGGFRQDLYYRLKVATATLPPLRERGGDVALLARHFLVQRGRGARRLSPAALARLEGHDWPGNVRELRNVLEVAAALAPGALILPEHLDLPPLDAAGGGGYHRELETWRRDKLERALQASGGSYSEAARRLGVSRQFLSYAARQLGLRRPRR